MDLGAPCSGEASASTPDPLGGVDSDLLGGVACDGVGGTGGGGAAPAGGGFGLDGAASGVGAVVVGADVLVIGTR